MWPVFKGQFGSYVQITRLFGCELPRRCLPSPQYGGARCRSVFVKVNSSVWECGNCIHVSQYTPQTLFWAVSCGTYFLAAELHPPTVSLRRRSGPGWLTELADKTEYFTGDVQSGFKLMFTECYLVQNVSYFLMKKNPATCRLSCRCFLLVFCAKCLFHRLSHRPVVLWCVICDTRGPRLI